MCVLIHKIVYIKNRIFALQFGIYLEHAGVDIFIFDFLKLSSPVWETLVTELNPAIWPLCAKCNDKENTL